MSKKKKTVESIKKVLGTIAYTSTSATDAALHNKFTPTPLFRVLEKHKLINRVAVEKGKVDINGKKSPKGVVWLKTEKLDSQVVENKEFLETILKEYFDERRKHNRKIRNKLLNIVKAENESDSDSENVNDIKELRNEIKELRSDIVSIKKMMQHILESLGETV